jgi:tRNA(His) 5'-end guanylyltransferase
MNAMNIACLELCKEAQGAKIGFVQSDEISIVLTDYDTLTTGAWFDYDQQKLASVSASIVTRAFNREIRKYFNATESPVREAEFDGRCWAMPEKEEVVNYFVWRQKDTTQNAISAAARCIYSSKQLDGKNSAQKQEMMFQKGINWNDYPIGFKRGRAVKKFVTGSNFTEDPVLEWKIDHAIPIFTEDRDYIKQTLPIPLT